MAWADSSFFHPTSRVYDDPGVHGLAFEETSIASGKDRLHAWFFPAASAEVRGTVLHCHGNAGNITAHFRFVGWLPEEGWNVLCFDYRGYGQSTGAASRHSAVEDVDAALVYTRSRPDVDAERLVVLGQSLGGAVAIAALAQPGAPAVAGLCIDGAFSSYREEAYFVCRQQWWLRPAAGLIARNLISDELAPRELVAALPAMPKLFVCGTADSIVGYEQTVELFERASEPKELWVLDGAEHTEVIAGQWPGGRERVLEFLNRCAAATVPAEELRP